MAAASVNSDLTQTMTKSGSAAGGILGCVKCNSDITGIASCTAAPVANANTGAITAVTC